MPTDQTDQAILEGITDAFVSLGSDRDDVTAEATLAALDIDSLDLAELAQIIDEQYNVKLAVGDVGDIKTVGDLVALVESRA